ncbi:proteasome regulatory particle base subunit [Quaeritorhiza haematococci]|nr:proteasome regulatory particle base subunit [Quaeritorhiza haematococci]
MTTEIKRLQQEICRWESRFQQQTRAHDKEVAFLHGKLEKSNNDLKQALQGKNKAETSMKKKEKEVRDLSHRNAHYEKLLQKDGIQCQCFDPPQHPPPAQPQPSTPSTPSTTSDDNNTNAGRNEDEDELEILVKFVMNELDVADQNIIALKSENKTLKKAQVQLESTFSASGALFASSLLHADCGSDILPRLIKVLCDNQCEITRFGACLGIGVAGMGPGTCGECVILRVLNMVSQHPYHDQMPILWHLCRRDRTAIPGKNGYQRWRTFARCCPTEALSLLERFLTSDEPQIRYGAVLAIGIACAGSGIVEMQAKLCFKHLTTHHFPSPSSLLSSKKDAVEVLQRMLCDGEKFVQQGALIALSFVLARQYNALPETYSATRRVFKGILECEDESLAKEGAKLGLLIFDAGTVLV